ncbi:MAG: type II toxin-antitoxin system PemK/MazF family toxin [Syntrophobacteraceae bacterium]|jgi:mRNA interferase MazF
MGRFVKGDIVVIPFPYSDLSASKKRPALVIAALDGDDVILCQITSQSISDRYGIPLNTADFRGGSLKHPSNIRPNRLFTADGRIASYRAGTIKEEKLQEVLQKIIEIVAG